MSDQPNQNNENQEQQPSYTPASPLKRTLAWVGLVYMLAFVGLNLYPFSAAGSTCGASIPCWPAPPPPGWR